jgi:hypothetical protein
LDGTPTTDGEKASRKPVAAWKNISLYDLTKAFVDADGKEWKLCTKYNYKSMQEQGIFNLSYFNSDNVAIFHVQKPHLKHL